MAIYTTIDKFRSHVKTVGLPTSSHFNVILPGAIGMNGEVNLASSKTVMMLCEATTIPGITIMTDELKMNGEVSDIPYMISYPPINLTFIEDNNFAARGYFEKWTNHVYDRTSRSAGYFDDVTGEVQIMVSDRAGNIRYCIKLHKAFPKMLNDQTYNYSSHDLVKTDVQFSYKYWERIDVTEKGDPTAKPRSTGAGRGFIQPPGVFGQQLTETLSNSTGRVTGIPSNMFGLDVGSDMAKWGPQIGAEFSRAGNGANAVLSTSGVSGGSAMGGAFSDLGGSMGTFGQTFGDLGKSLATIGSISGRVGQAVGGIAGTVGAVNQVLSGLGINTGLGKVAADISQVAGKVGVLSQIGGLPGNLGALGANLGAVGSELQGAVKAVGELPGATNQVKNVISNLGEMFGTRGSELTEAGSAVQSNIDAGRL